MLNREKNPNNIAIYFFALTPCNSAASVLNGVPPVSCRGVVRVDINLQDVDIDQCAADGWFAGTHRCNLTTTEVSVKSAEHADWARGESTRSGKLNRGVKKTLSVTSQQGAEWKSTKSVGLTMSGW